jgi:hypothetical protein
MGRAVLCMAGRRSRSRHWAVARCHVTIPALESKAQRGPVACLAVPLLLRHNDETAAVGVIGPL